MIKPVNGMTVIKTVDNTNDISEALDLSYVKGYSDWDRLTVPNEGIDQLGRKIWYFNSNVYMLSKDTALIPENNIFMIEDDLTMPCVITESLPHKQTGGLERGQNYYKIIQSNVLSVPVGNVIIIKPSAYYWFNKNGKRYSVVFEHNVMVNIRKSIEPGPSYEFLKKVNDSGLFEIPQLTFGEDKNGIVKYFKQHFFEIFIKGVEYWIVDKSQIYGEGI